jgi:hypothetical protein
MRNAKWILLMLVVVGAGVNAMAQSDLDVFPTGTTTMTYNVTSEDLSEPQILELVVTAHEDERYTVRMVTEQTGSEDELATGFGFLFGATRVSSGGGHDVSYSWLQDVLEQKDRLQEGQSFLLRDGGTFTDIVSVEIAGVWCFEGVVIDPDESDVRMTVAFALTNPVYISPRIRAEELRDGEWVETFALELVEYTVEEGGG